MRREVILGPPGTGKTTELIRRLEAAFKKGIRPEQVAFLAFTRKAASVAVQRCLEHFGYTKDRFVYFRTIHSLAFTANKIESSRVMQEQHYRDFGMSCGWDFTASYNDFEERPSYGRGLGDELLRCYDLANSRVVPMLTEAQQGGYKFDAVTAENFYNQFNEYKRAKNLLTFNDFLDRPAKLNMKLVIIDEAQDLTKLQWKFVRESFGECEEVIMAGDDDQCIYHWSGADLNFFLNVRAELTQLKHSWRCRKKIWEMCNKLTGLIGNRYDKQWEPVGEGGEVNHIPNPEDVDISKGEWLILVRKNRRKRNYFKLCLNAGRIFHDGYRWINETPWFGGVIAYEKLRRGEVITDRQAINLLSVTSYARKKAELVEYTWEDFEWKLEGREPWRVACNALDLEQKLFIMRCEDNGEDFFSPGKIKISTIHSAKGGEADNVLLDIRLSGVPAEQFKRDPDSERRVWYVGVSRARSNLILTGGIKNKALGF